ncbi:major facilitator superfamily domain-containing protein [Tricladium varicosporioides]|nr:major facilitator superfamily domain-containing protein [Hymenoscyphus varicosporioides]
MPVFERIRSSNWFIISTVCFTSFTDTFIYGVIVPVLPYSLKEQARVPEVNVQFWSSLLLAAFGLAQFLFSPLFGCLAGQSSSRKRSFMFSSLATTAATVLLYSAQNTWLMAFSRFFQGFSAAIVYTIGFALLADAVDTPDLRACIGCVMFSLDVGMVLSPTLGGLLYVKFGYKSLFIAILSLIAINALLVLLLIEKKKLSAVTERHAFRRSRGEGSEYGTFQSMFNEAANQERSGTSSSDGDLTILIPHPEDSTTEVACHHHYATPLVTLIKSPRVLTSLYRTWVSLMILGSFDAALPIFVKYQFSWGPIGGGLIFLTLTCSSSLSPLAGKLSDKFPSRWLTSLWFILSGASLFHLLLVNDDTLTSKNQKILLCFFLTLYGFTMNFGTRPLGSDLSQAVESIELENPGIFEGRNISAHAYSMYTGAYAAGILFGPLWASLAFGNWGWIYYVISLGILSVSAAIPVRTGGAWG